VERVFLAANPRSALILGQARGAVLASLGEAGVKVIELSARQVKKSVTGSGAAGKTQVQAMVTRLLGLAEIPAADAADALALALTYAQAGPLADLPMPTRRRSSRQAITRLVMERLP
jgi:crossover junction endodeoxyribonuclease RuvC